MTRLESKLAQTHVALTGPMRQQVLQLMMTRLIILHLHQIIFSGSEKISLTYIIKIMTINDQIRGEKLQHHINRVAAKISALSSGKINKCEYLTGEDILPSNQQQIIEQAKFTYSPLGHAFEKQIKTIEDQGQKQIDGLQVLELKVIQSGSNNKPVITQEI